MPESSKSGEPKLLQPVIALTGFMAAGKSTIGRALATHLHWHFVDLDFEVELRAKLRVHEIFAQQGEPRFREIETDVLRQVLERVSSPTVIALGGGTFVQPENAERLRARHAQVVFLELAVEEMLQRCRTAGELGSVNPRPLAVDAEAFRATYERRLPHYRRATIAVQVHGKSAEQAAQEIANALDLSTALRHKR